MIRVVVADDHAIVRAGVRALLEAEDDVKVVAEAGDGRQAIEAVARHLPEVLIIDLSMAGMNGVTAIAEVHRLAPRVGVLVLSMHGAPEYVRPALRAGASGYIVKGAGLEELVTALRAVARGERFFTGDIERIAAIEATANDGGKPGLGDLAALTPREREVLQRVAEGQTNKEIASALGLSPKTVDTHRMHVMQKLDLHDAQSLTRFALRHRLVEE